MREIPVLDGIPDYHDTIEFLRLREHRSRADLARAAHLSTSRLDKIIQRRELPSPDKAALLADAFDLDHDQKQHLHELWQPSRPLPPAQQQRRRLTALHVQNHLDDLDTRDVLAVYFDPLRTALHGNTIFHNAVPGLAEADHNYILWMFSSTAARDKIDNWETEAPHTAAILRAMLGRYRNLPRARTLFAKLRAIPEFRRIWDTTPMQVVYGCHRTAPLRLRTPGSDQRLTLSLDISDYGEYTEILITNGTFFDPHAIAS